MTIALDARIINSSTGRYIERLVHYLEEIDKKNTYLLLVRKKDEHFYTPQNKNFKVVIAEFDNYSLNEQIGFYRLLNSLHADLVHFCMPQQPLLYKGLHITTVHDLNLLKTYNSDKNYIIYKLKQTVGRYVFHRIAHTSAHIICPTNYVKQDYINYTGISEEKVTVTYEGCDVVTAKATAYEPLKKKKFILYVGQQSDYKNIRRLILAHQKLRLKDPDLLLVLAGSLTGKNAPPLLINQKWVKDNKFKGVLYTGFVPDEQLFWLFQHCAAYIFPSLMEGFGLPGLEAMTSGAAVVSSNATCLPEVFGDAAYYFNPKDVDNMANAIREVLEDTSLRKSLQKKGLEQSKKYSWKRMAQQTHDIYMQTLRQKN